jgi:hypothetical protein
VLVHVLEIVVLAPSIDDHEEAVIIHLGDDAVVIDAALVIHDQGESGLAWDKRLDICHSQSLEEGCSIFTDNADLSHVRDVEEADTLSAMQVLLDDTLGVEHGHVVTGEGHHLGLEHILVVGVQVGTLEDLCGKLSDNLV